MKQLVKPLTKLAVISCSIFLLSACIEKEKIAKVPDAENILFTSKGDMLVTGGESIYQLKKTVSPTGKVNYSSTDLMPGLKCAFTGMAESTNWVYAACQELKFEWKGWTFKLWNDNHLLAANVNQQPLKFEIISHTDNDPLDTLTLPNGLAFSAQGDLIVADSNFLGRSGIARIKLAFSNGKPKIQQLEKDWLGLEYGLQTPNGVRVDGRHLFVSDNKSVRRFTFDNQGNIPLLFHDQQGNEISNLPDDTLFYQGNLIIDDIMPYCGGIAVTHFVEGQLVYQAANGERYSTLPLSFQFPSSLAYGKGANFSGNELYVTEKGVLRELGTDFGNRVSVVNMEFDLGNPNTCQAILSL